MPSASAVVILLVISCVGTLLNLGLAVRALAKARYLRFVVFMILGVFTYLLGIGVTEGLDPFLAMIIVLSP